MRVDACGPHARDLSQLLSPPIEMGALRRPPRRRRSRRMTDAQGKGPKVDVLLQSNWAEAGLVQDVRRGLGSQPRTLPPKWLYDDAGSRLFDEITRLPEYYPTEAERAILRDHADEIAALCDATT